MCRHLDGQLLAQHTRRALQRMFGTAKPHVQFMPLGVSCFILGSLGGPAIGAGVESIVEPLGGSAARFAIHDDRVPSDVRHVLAHRVGPIHLSEVAGGKVGVAIARDRSTVAVAFSSVHPDRSLGREQEIVLLLGCGGELESVGKLSESFYGGAPPQGWENGITVSFPGRCQDVVVALRDARGEVTSYGVVPIRTVATPNGDFAIGHGQWRPQNAPIQNVAGSLIASVSGLGDRIET
jgi:hypothetical protein